MCGLAGFWDRRCQRFEPAIFAMTNALRHRGPDGAGYWFDGRHGLALGHRRLAILDCSDRGRQPMFSASGRWALVYNGEVYNFAEIRARVQEATRGSYPFVGGSDTEVILGAVETFGLWETLTQMVGMFAMTLWDRERAELHLVRDRLGIKPLYWAWHGEVLLFGSELKALRAYPGFDPPLDRRALAGYLSRSAVGGEHTIYEGVYRVRPGAVLSARSPGKERLEERRWWRAEEVVSEGIRSPFMGDEEQATDELERELRRAVGQRMVADVPLGAFLSGGIDSTTVVALMQAQSGRPVKTFSIGNAAARYDEADDAARVARFLGTEHTSLIVEPRDALAVIERLPMLYDEPFADASQIPTFLVSELARRQVTVALSGDGGDEVFGGYNRHVWGPKIWRGLSRVPPGARGHLGQALLWLSPGQWEALIERAGRLGGPQAAALMGRAEALLGRSGAASTKTTPSLAPWRLIGDKLHKLAEIFDVPDAEALYRRLLSNWGEGPRVVRGMEGAPRTWSWEPEPQVASLAERWMFRDLVGYLPEDILTKVDRASMGVSLEARVPLLDHRLVAFAWRLPLSMKVRGRQGKYILRRVLDRYVPRVLVERPKMGFGVPLDAWLRAELRPWAEALLSRERLEREGFLEVAPVQALWREHLSGRRSRAYELWNILMFQAWLEQHHRVSARRPFGGSLELRQVPGMGRR
ncbi:asparagine synthase (glutamine-hydrolyzing) [Lujinxingia litoralis]|uniref:asparagine synthase (glutamine-hydrolyzing) n=1 Tax=Lujinxingia litoralis TaxID=2211119 RepID=A0A328C437_9DELT|nr:asparagine synthase (glutamine-hydrolyzing) [Lujinxingia litoralis]RAL20709.1 asparagine synthase (glutamine-hydrolyzing) [Lujinxingia litoralis]